MFWLQGRLGRIEYAFTDAELDLAGSPSAMDRLAAAFDVPAVASMRQVHGVTVADADRDGPRDGESAQADALVTGAGGPAVLVRVADCTPIVLGAPDDDLVAVVHAGRVGLVAGVVPAAVDALRARGAGRLVAVLGPRACGRCYEVPQAMADEVDAAVPRSRSVTSWGTPAVDVGAGVIGQLELLDVQVDDPGSHVCTIEDERFFSYRRQGTAAGRFGAVAVVRP